MAEYKKELLIEAELEWYETKCQQVKMYLEAVNLADLKDRIEWKATSKGGTMPIVIASREAQAKNFMDMMEKLPKLLSALDDLRNKYKEKQVRTRGDVEIPEFMKND